MISSRPHHRPLNRISQQARMKRWTRKAAAILDETYGKMLRDGDAAIVCGSKEDARRLSRERIVPTLVPTLVNITNEAVDLTEINPTLEAKMWDGLLDYLEYRFSYAGTAKVTLTLGRIGQAIFAHDPDEEERRVLQNFLSRFVSPLGKRGNSWFGPSFSEAYQGKHELVRCRVTNAVDHIYTFIKWGGSSTTTDLLDQDGNLILMP